MTPAHEEFRNDHVAVAFLIRFRTYGTWLHGDARGSVDRLHNRYGSPKLPPNPGVNDTSRVCLSNHLFVCHSNKETPRPMVFGKSVRRKSGVCGLSTYVPIMLTLSSRPIAVQKKSGRY